MSACAIGLELCLQKAKEKLGARRFGLLCNHASVDLEFRCAHALLHERFPGQLRAILTPQHGLFGEQQDNMIETPHGRDRSTGAPIHSLYAERRRPSAAMLDGIDVLVVDLQDVGTRVYTFIWTLMFCLEACAENDIPVLVLDRPNPLGGEVVEGPVLTPGYESFVGAARIPMRHGLSIGEMALFLNQSRGIGAELDVVPMEGWARDMLFAQTGRTWVPTSPNLPRESALYLYPGLVLFEGTLLSEGRGSTTPFELIGAPWIDPDRLHEALADHDMPGIAARPMRFEPTFQKHANVSCGALFLHVKDPALLRSYRLALLLIATIRDLWPSAFRWHPGPYEYEDQLMPIDMLTGSSEFREACDAGRGIDGITTCAEVDTNAWWQRVEPFLLYPRR